MNLESFWGQGLFFGWLSARHVAVMMYWVWLPAFFVSAFVALRYRGAAAEAVQRGGSGNLRSLLWAALWGLTRTPQRKRSLAASLELLRESHPAVALAAYLASRNLAPYFLALWMLLLGIEFAAGQVVGALAMIALTSAGLRYAIPEEGWKRLRDRLPSGGGSRGAASDEEGETSWRALLLSARGWGKTLRYVGRELGGAVIPLAAGVLIGGFILAAGLQPWWVDLDSVGGGGVWTDLLNAFVAPALSLAAAIGPVGSLPVATSLFKAYGLAYPGLVAFVLAGALKPQDIAAFKRALGPRVALRLTILLYFSAALSGLIATGVFALFGFRPGHVPLFRGLVDAIIMWAVPGMGKPMPGMGGFGGM